MSDTPKRKAPITDAAIAGLIHEKLKPRLREADIRDVLEQALGTIADLLHAGTSVTLRGLGTLQIKQAKGRPGYNPKTGERFAIPEKISVRFKASDTIKQSLNS